MEAEVTALKVRYDTDSFTAFIQQTQVLKLIAEKKKEEEK